jgi:triosephosphate isomerase
MTRKPLALANWKMDMRIAESLAFIRRFQTLADDLLDQVEVVICPPYTALWAITWALKDARLELGGQNMAPTTAPARTGEISPMLLADAGCRWVMLGHWEIRRHLGDDDAVVKRKIHLALDAGLSPLVLIGEGRDENRPLPAALARHLEATLADCEPVQVIKVAIVYEPEGAIGAAKPFSAAHVTQGCGFIRGWLREQWGHEVADQIRIIYGGSVAPEHAGELLASPHLDGLGVTRQGRNPAAFLQIVREIARLKAGIPNEKGSGRGDTLQAPRLQNSFPG